jgi:hypothetical protein
LVQTDLKDTILTDCRIYGISAWGMLTEGTKQQGLIITPREEPAITVDDLEVAQFVYLLLHNEKIRRVIDTVGKKGVLLLGRFTEDRVSPTSSSPVAIRYHLLTSDSGRPLRANTGRSKAGPLSEGLRRALERAGGRSADLVNLPVASAR